jgi:4-amino-4-deoxy-L-arabinose transferase-like glycosyltransferase
VKNKPISGPEDSSGPPPSQAGWLRQILPAMAAALAIRMVVVFFTYRSLPDADKFYESFGWEMGWIARALASGHGFSSPYYPWSGPTAIMSPLYPWLLSLVFRLFGVYSLTSAFVILSINSLFSTLTCIPVYFSAKYSLGPRAAKIAAWVWALYPFAIYFSAGRVWEYALTGLLFTTCFCIAQRIHQSAKPLAWIGFGALYGLTAHSNASVMSTLPFLLGFALWQAHKAGKRWVLNGALTMLTFFLVLTPWTIRNYRALGVICPVRDNFWLEFYSGNYGDASLNPVSPHPASNPAEMNKFLSMGEKAYLNDKHALAIDSIEDHPLFIAQKTLRRFIYYWTGFWSLSRDELQREPYDPGNIFYLSVITLLMLRGARRLWSRNRAAALPYLVLIGVFPLAYYITYPLMDYRQPIEPAIVVLAVAGALALKRAKAGQPGRVEGNSILQSK